MTWLTLAFVFISVIKDL